MVEGSLGSIFLNCCAGHATAPPRPSLQELDTTLGKLLERGRTAWPTLAISPADFIQHLAAHAPEDQPPIAFLETVHAEDLYLTCACALGLARAHELFDRKFLSHMPALLRSMRIPAARLDEVAQLVRERLLVATEGAPPKIAGYSGRGPLLLWVRIVTRRTALNLLRRREPLHAGADLVAASPMLPPGANVELDYLRQRYRSHFQQALRDAFAALSDEERNLLRLYVADGLSQGKIGALLGVHQSTVMRRIAAARETILVQARRLLHERLRLSSTEFDSLIAVLQSELELSISGLLGKPHE